MTRLFVMKCLRYESAITRFFMRGRTETLRPLSEHSCAFVKAMDNPGASAATKVGGCVSYPWYLVRVASSRQAHMVVRWRCFARRCSTTSHTSGGASRATALIAICLACGC